MITKTYLELTATLNLWQHSGYSRADEWLTRLTNVLEDYHRERSGTGACPEFVEGEPARTDESQRGPLADYWKLVMAAWHGGRLKADQG